MSGFKRKPIDNEMENSDNEMENSDNEMETYDDEMENSDEYRVDDRPIKFLKKSTYPTNIIVSQDADYAVRQGQGNTLQDKPFAVYQSTAHAGIAFVRDKNGNCNILTNIVPPESNNDYYELTIGNPNAVSVCSGDTVKSYTDLVENFFKKIEQKKESTSSDWEGVFHKLNQLIKYRNKEYSVPSIKYASINSLLELEENINKLIVGDDEEIKNLIEHFCEDLIENINYLTGFLSNKKGQPNSGAQLKKYSPGEAYAVSVLISEHESKLSTSNEGVVKSKNWENSITVIPGVKTTQSIRKDPFFEKLQKNLRQSHFENPLVKIYNERPFVDLFGLFDSNTQTRTTTSVITSAEINNQLPNTQLFFSNFSCRVLAEVQQNSNGHYEFIGYPRTEHEKSLLLREYKYINTTNGVNIPLDDSIDYLTRGSGQNLEETTVFLSDLKKNIRFQLNRIQNINIDFYRKLTRQFGQIIYTKGGSKSKSTRKYRKSKRRNNKKSKRRNKRKTYKKRR